MLKSDNYHFQLGCTLIWLLLVRTSSAGFIAPFQYFFMCQHCPLFCLVPFEVVVNEYDQNGESHYSGTCNEEGQCIHKVVAKNHKGEFFRLAA